MFFYKLKSFLVFLEVSFSFKRNEICQREVDCFARDHVQKVLITSVKTYFSVIIINILTEVKFENTQTNTRYEYKRPHY